VLDATRRQLEDYVRSQRGDVKYHDSPNQGGIAKLVPEQDYGFIETADGDEVYFYRNSVVGAKFAVLAVGDHVRYVYHSGEGAKGPQASSITKIGKHHPFAPR